MTVTARMAPAWITMLKTSERCPRPSFSAISRWPVLEMGKNSVTPSITPNRIDLQQVVHGWSELRSTRA